jgi:hypothetical protein
MLGEVCFWRTPPDNRDEEHSMKRVVGAFLAVVMIVALSAVSVPTAQASNSQQDKMKACNDAAGKKQLKGDERKDFMSKCLSADAPAASTNSQQEKMKACNEAAGKKGLKGDERKSFMSTCLSSEKK